MAKTLHNREYIEVDGNDISDHCFRISTPSSKERVDVSGFNDDSASEWLPGIRTDEITLGVLQDFASGNVHDILSTIYENETTVTVKVRPLSAAVSATNPEFGGPAKLYDYNGLDGERGARSEIPVTFLPADPAGFRWSNS